MLVFSSYLSVRWLYVNFLFLSFLCSNGRIMLCIVGRWLACLFVYSGTIKVMKVMKTKQIMIGSYFL